MATPLTAPEDVKLTLDRTTSPTFSTHSSCDSFTFVSMSPRTKSNMWYSFSFAEDAAESAEGKMILSREPTFAKITLPPNLSLRISELAKTLKKKKGKKKSAVNVDALRKMKSDRVSKQLQRRKARVALAKRVASENQETLAKQLLDKQNECARRRSKQLAEKTAFAKETLRKVQRTPLKDKSNVTLAAKLAAKQKKCAMRRSKFQARKSAFARKDVQKVTEAPATQAKMQQSLKKKLQLVQKQAKQRREKFNKVARIAFATSRNRKVKALPAKLDKQSKVRSKQLQSAIAKKQLDASRRREQGMLLRQCSSAEEVLHARVVSLHVTKMSAQKEKHTLLLHLLKQRKAAVHRANRLQEVLVRAQEQSTKVAMRRAWTWFMRNITKERAAIRARRYAVANARREDFLARRAYKACLHLRRYHVRNEQKNLEKKEALDNKMKKAESRRGFFLDAIRYRALSISARVASQMAVRAAKEIGRIRAIAEHIMQTQELAAVRRRYYVEHLNKQFSERNNQMQSQAWLRRRNRQRSLSAKLAEKLATAAHNRMVFLQMRVEKASHIGGTAAVKRVRTAVALMAVDDANALRHNLEKTQAQCALRRAQVHARKQAKAKMLSFSTATEIKAKQEKSSSQGKWSLADKLAAKQAACARRRAETNAVKQQKARKMSQSRVSIQDSKENSLRAKLLAKENAQEKRRAAALEKRSHFAKRRLAVVATKLEQTRATREDLATKVAQTLDSADKRREKYHSSRTAFARAQCMKVNLNQKEKAKQQKTLQETLEQKQKLAEFRRNAHTSQRLALVKRREINEKVARAVKQSNQAKQMDKENARCELAEMKRKAILHKRVLKAKQHSQKVNDLQKTLKIQASVAACVAVQMMENAQLEADARRTQALDTTRHNAAVTVARSTAARNRLARMERDRIEEARERQAFSQMQAEIRRLHEKHNRKYRTGTAGRLNASRSDSGSSDGGLGSPRSSLSMSPRSPISSRTVRNVSPARWATPVKRSFSMKTGTPMSSMSAFDMNLSQIPSDELSPNRALPLSPSAFGYKPPADLDLTIVGKSLQPLQVGF